MIRRSSSIALRLAMDIADTLPQNPYGIKSAIPNYGIRAGCRTYVTCFSTKADDLSQWRAYAQPPPGFAIGIDRPTLEAVAAFQGFKLVECEYDLAKQKPPIEAVLQSHLLALNADTLFNPTWGSKAGMVLSIRYNPRLGAAIADLAVRFKAPEFKEEGEIRAIWPAQQKSVPDSITNCETESPTARLARTDACSAAPIACELPRPRQLSEARALLKCILSVMTRPLMPRPTRYTAQPWFATVETLL
jgi:hypothetical protein